MASQLQQQDPKVIPVKVLVDKQANKVVAVEATKDFVDTLFSFLSLPLGTIIRLLNNKHDDQEQKTPEPLLGCITNLYQSVDTLFSFLSLPVDTIIRLLNAKHDDQHPHDYNHEQQTPEPLLGCITNLYQSVENLTLDDVWNSVCKDMLLCPRNPCEQLCMKLFLNVDDTEPTPKVLVCDSCNRFTTFQNLACFCGKLIDRTPHDLDLKSQGKNNESNHVGDARSGAFVKEGSLFLVFDDLTVVPTSLVPSMKMLNERGYSGLSQLEQITQSFGKKEILNLLKNIIISDEPLTNTILARNSKKKDKPLNQFASAIKARTATSDSKMDVKLVRSKSLNKIVSAEAKGDFVDFLFGFLSIPLGSIVKLLGGNSFVGCVDNLYKSVETLDSSWCTDSRSVLLNPGIAPQFGCPNQPLIIPDVEPPNYFYGTATTIKGAYGPSTRSLIPSLCGVISKSNNRSIYNVRRLTALDPRSPNRSREGAVGFVKRPALYAVGDDLRVRPLSTNSCLSYLKELNLPFDDLEVKVISISEAEALSLLGASLTSKYALTSGFQDFLDMPKHESSLTSKYIQTSRLDDLLKDKPNPET